MGEGAKIDAIDATLRTDPLTQRVRVLTEADGRFIFESSLTDCSDNHRSPKDSSRMPLSSYLSVVSASRGG
jgi:hypothetical protein